jgi:hypothetical protein
MPLPRPEPGLVIHFDYLWRHEHEAGQEEGSKGRPCLIVAVADDENGRLEVVVAPVTRVAPVPPAAGVEIPPRVKHHLGLDDKRSWVITTDLNVFLWPGVDIRPVPNAPAGKYDYGFLPPRLFEQIRQRIVAAATVATRRSE